MTPLTLGTRGSQLALWQANFVADALRAAQPGIEVRLEVIQTRGDAAAAPGSEPVPVGFFTREIESALLDHRIDAAVHSLKDLPSKLPQGLGLGAVMARHDAADALICKSGTDLDALPEGAIVLTGSPRRRAQLLYRRPDLRCLPIRGNVPTRLTKFDNSSANGMVLACAGLERLNLGGRISQRLDPVQFVPAAGQGALAVEIRCDDQRLADLCRGIDDPATRRCTAIERAFMSTLGGGCRLPAGVYARESGTPGCLDVCAMVADADGRNVVRHDLSNVRAEGEQAAQEIGVEVAQWILSHGGGAILAQFAREASAHEGDAD